jgi:CRISPR-associated protein Cmr6
MRHGLPQARPSLDSHPGLLLQRFVAHPADGSEQWTRAKQAIFQSAIQSAENPELRSLYVAAYTRWLKQVSAIPGIRHDFVKSAGRLIVGLGSENVLETGIRLHHNYGMPILPGSALKGLAAHYCHTVWGAVELKFKKDADYHNLLFGNTDESGCIIFHDGWFVPNSEAAPFKLDVMTPHHPKWLDGEVAPTDFDSPVPVSFLSVSGKFLIAVSWYGPSGEESNAWTERALECLREALFQWGIGGKTSSGYGLFDEAQWQKDDEAEKKKKAHEAARAESEAKLAAMSPIDRTVQTVLANDPEKTAPDYMKLFKELKKDETSLFSTPEDRVYVAKLVKASMVDAKKWKDKDKDGERKAYIQKILGEK